MKKIRAVEVGFLYFSTHGPTNIVNTVAPRGLWMLALKVLKVYLKNTVETPIKGQKRGPL